MNRVRVESFLQWIIGHNAVVIESLVGLIVLFVLFLAYRTFVSARDEELHPASGLGNAQQLEETLKKVLEKANALGGTQPVQADQAALLTQISDLKQSIESKQAEIEVLKSAGPSQASSSGAAAASSAGAAVDTSALESQIKELQSKLAEYEIISEDIADLSFYKEENAKLQKEIETLKSSVPAEANTTTPQPAVPTSQEVVAAPAPAPAPEPALDAAPAPVSAPAPETLQAPQPAAAVAPNTEVAPAAAPDSEASIQAVNDDIMAEFAAAISEQKNQPEDKNSLANRVQEKAQASSSEAIEATEEKPTEEISTQEMPTEKPDADEVSLGSMDMDKMISEAGELESAVDVASVENVNPLEGALDPAKLSEEAQLMNEFENFAKKKESGT